MKKSHIILSLSVLTIVGCTSVYRITDTVTLYPENKAAETWGVINFYSQYQSNSLPGRLSITLPDGKQLNGQMTFVEDSGKTTEEGSFWDNVRVGVGVGSGGGFGGVSVSPRVGSYHSDKSNVSINAFGSQLGLNCQGEFNQRQKNGTVTCKLTNGMRYRGTIRRVIVK